MKDNHICKATVSVTIFGAEYTHVVFFPIVLDEGHCPKLYLAREGSRIEHAFKTNNISTSAAVVIAPEEDIATMQTDVTALFAADGFRSKKT